MTIARLDHHGGDWQGYVGTWLAPPSIPDFLGKLCLNLACVQSYKASMLVIYNPRVVPDLKIPHITTLDL